MMDAVAYGQSSVGSLMFHEDMPIRYRLERNHYSLVASIDIDSIRPGVVFSIESDTHIGLRIQGEYSSMCFGGFDPLRAAARGSESDQLYFIWARAADYPLSVDSQCSRALAPNESAYTVTITIVDFSGAVIGLEEIPFAIKKNGIHFEFDGV